VTTVLRRAAAAKVGAGHRPTGGNLLRIAVAGRIAIDITIDDAERAWSRRSIATSGSKRPNAGQIQRRMRRVRHLRAPKRRT
jgi:hypothetical protein